MKKILVTGAGGFAGTHLIQALQAQGNSEIFAAVYKATSDISALVPVDHVFAGDLTDFAFAEKLIKETGSDIIYHLAALSVVHNSADLATTIMSANMTLQYNLLEAVRQHAQSARFIAICSANQYGLVKAADLPIKETTPFRPLNPYAVSKISQEMLALEYHLAHGLDVVMLRPFNHTGEGQTTDFVIPMLAQQFVGVERGGLAQVEVGNLDTSRDFTDVKDMVQAYMLAAEKGVAGEAYNIGSGKGYTVKEILTILQEVTGQTVEIREMADKVRKNDVPILIADASKFHAATGWEPHIALSDTLKRILVYLRQQS